MISLDLIKPVLIQEMVCTTLIEFGPLMVKEVLDLGTMKAGVRQIKRITTEKHGRPAK
jgi:hypothetical protein